MSTVYLYLYTCIWTRHFGKYTFWKLEFAVPCSVVFLQWNDSATCSMGCKWVREWDTPYQSHPNDDACVYIIHIVLEMVIWRKKVFWWYRKMFFNVLFIHSTMITTRTGSVFFCCCNVAPIWECSTWSIFRKVKKRVSKFCKLHSHPVEAISLWKHAILPLLTDCCQDCMFVAAKKKADVKPLACKMTDKYISNHLLHLEI